MADRRESSAEGEDTDHRVSRVGHTFIRRAFATAFVRGLRELGWVEGRDVAIEYRWGEARVDRFAELATEFAQLKVDVIFTYGTATAVAAKQATSVIPIVFTLVADPVEVGLAASLARPGSNITGVSR